MKTYSTFAGAQRAADGKPIVRLLNDPEELWIVVPKLHMDLMLYTAEGRRYHLAGSTTLFDVAATEVQ
jgi:hypothetical protein